MSARFRSGHFPMYSNPVAMRDRNAKFYAREQLHRTRRERPAMVERGIR